MNTIRQLEFWPELPLWEFHLQSLRKQLTQLSFGYASRKTYEELNNLMTKTAEKNGNGRVAGKAPTDPQFTTFVNFTLSPDVKEDMLEKFPTQEKVFQAMELLLMSNYRISFSYVFAQDHVVCALTCRNEESANNGKTMTSFSDTWVKAIMSAAYKHFFALDEDWRNAETTQNRPEFG